MKCERTKEQKREREKKIHTHTCADGPKNKYDAKMCCYVDTKGNEILFSIQDGQIWMSNVASISQ